jgi:hypothetical protein
MYAMCCPTGRVYPKQGHSATGLSKNPSYGLLSACRISMVESSRKGFSIGLESTGIFSGRFGCNKGFCKETFFPGGRRMAPLRCDSCRSHPHTMSLA